MYNVIKVRDVPLCRKIENLFNVQGFAYGNIRDPVLRMTVRDKMSGDSIFLTK